MNTIKDTAIRISDAHPFSEFIYSAKADNLQDKVVGKISLCQNHLDVEFMNLLDQGAHLDIARFPL